MSRVETNADSTHLSLFPLYPAKPLPLAMSDGVQLNASSAMSSRSRDTAMTGRHDGHSDGHLNCVAMRHGWSRNFSLAPSEVTHMSYETLTRALEFHTLNLRPMMHRVFVEHPPASGTWCKIRPFKNDGSLQTVLVRAFFDGRLSDGVVTVLDIRDGADRREEGDGLSLKSVSSRIFHAKDKEDKKPGGWFSKLLKRVSPKPAPNPDASESHTQLRELDEDDVDDHPQSNHQEAQKKPVATSIFQSGLFSYFMSPPPPPPRETKPSPEVQEEQMRKRGWRPPGLRNRKPKEKNPFLSGHERDDPFNDPTAVAEHDDDGESRDIDEFFQMERPDGEVPMNNVNGNQKDKAWSRFTRNKSSKSKGKGKGKEREQPEEKKERPMNKDQDWTPPAGSINSDVE